MCRLFAQRAARPVEVRGPLLTDPHALVQQSCCDRRGLCHDSGWGIGFYAEGQPRCIRSDRPAAADPRYREWAEAVVAPTVLAHVRLASAGGIAERNSHPFVHGRWMFAHNGTLFGFAEQPDRLRDLIPEHLRSFVEGDTDSEHAFYFLLGRLEQATASLDGPADADAVAKVFADTIRTLAELLPGAGEERSQLNFVLTDGRVMVASRWVHSLYRQERPGAVAVASEPTTPEGWAEVPDRSLVRIDAELRCALAPIG